MSSFQLQLIASMKETLPNRVVGSSVCSWAACARSKREKPRKEAVGVSAPNLRHLRHNSIQHAERAMHHFGAFPFPVCFATCGS